MELNKFILTNIHLFLLLSNTTFVQINNKQLKIGGFLMDLYYDYSCSFYALMTLCNFQITTNNIICR